MKYISDTVQHNTADITFTNKNRFLNNTVIIQSITKHILVINIKSLTTCFSSLNHHQAKYQNTVLVHSASTVFWNLAWWWFSELKHVAKFLILITNICCVIDWINYCIIAKHNGMAPIKKDLLTHKLLYCNASIIMTTCTLILIITCFSCYFPGSYRLLSNVIQHYPYNTD
jgi:hypothetical protein